MQGLSLIYLDRRPVYTEEKDAMGEEYFRVKMRYSMTLSQHEGKKGLFLVFCLYFIVLSL